MPIVRLHHHGNQARRTGGMYGIGWDQMRDPAAYSTCAFNQFLDNELSEASSISKAHSCWACSAVLRRGACSIRRQFRLRQRHSRQSPARQSYVARCITARIPWRSQGRVRAGRDTLIESNQIDNSSLALDVYPNYVTRCSA